MQYTLFPWVHNSSNHACDADQLRPCAVPDRHPAAILQYPGLLGMAAGDFVEVFSREEYIGHFDAVVTCFFLDTAHNVVEYMEIIWRVLKVKQQKHDAMLYVSSDQRVVLYFFVCLLCIIRLYHYPADQWHCLEILFLRASCSFSRTTTPFLFFCFLLSCLYAGWWELGESRSPAMALGRRPHVPAWR